MDYEYTAWLKANEERKFYECDPVADNFEAAELEEYDREYRERHGSF